MVGTGGVLASVCAVLLLSSPAQSQDSLHHHGITVNFDTEDCDLGHHENTLFSVFQSFTLNTFNVDAEIDKCVANVRTNQRPRLSV